jgi:Generalcontrol nonderepressible 1 (Gcn1) N-terminal
MANEAVNGVQKLDRPRLERSLFSSSTKLRISTLHAAHLQLEQDGKPLGCRVFWKYQLTIFSPEIDVKDVRSLLSLLFETYPLYIDRRSREAVRRCLQAVCANAKALECFPGLISSLKTEAAKPGIAAANAFVLTEWFSVLLIEFAQRKELWSKWGLDIILADTQTLATCLNTSSKNSVKHSALVVTRRALRNVFRSAPFGPDTVSKLVSALTAKGPNGQAKNAIILGVVAGVAARVPTVKPAFEAVKKECYAFYTREVIGSRVALPSHIGNGLHDLFQGFTTMEDLQKDLIPAIEKGLLRAPEVVLNDLVAPMVNSLRADLDLSELLQKNLLRPLLSNVKSTNPSIRSGALRTFEAIAEKSQIEPVTDKVCDEILTPLKQNKVTVPEQKILHAQMLKALHASPTLAKKIPAGLAPVALKEANEAAVEAETAAIVRHVISGYKSGASVDASVAESFGKGLVDKKSSVRRIWALQTGQVFWSLSQEELQQPAVLSLAQVTLGKMSESFNEVLKNPLPAAQSGLATVAATFAAISLSKFRGALDPKVKTIIDKAAIAKHLLVAEPKPSFLLNFRVYTKLQGSEEVTWAARALAALSIDLASGNRDPDVEEAWSQAFLFFITAATIPQQARKEAASTLAEAYCKHPAKIGQVIVGGIWRWRHYIDVNERDTAAASAKSGNSQLHLALRAVCPTPEEATKLGSPIETTVLEDQLLHLLILSRPGLVPHASWIDLCLRTGVDPGRLVGRTIQKCLQEIKNATEVGLALAAAQRR